MRMQLHFLLMMETNVDGSTLTIRLSATFQNFHLLQKPISFLKKTFCTLPPPSPPTPPASPAKCTLLTLFRMGGKKTPY